MRSFKKLLCILLAATLIICSFSGCEDNRNTNPTIDAPAAKPSTGGQFNKPSTYSVKIDHYAIPFTLSSYIPDRELTLYKNIINTYINYGNSVSFEAATNYDIVIQLLETYFPVLYSDTTGITVNTENNTIGWSYTSKNKAEHDKAISDFTDNAEQLLVDFRFDDSDTEIAMLIYERLYKNVEYYSFKQNAEQSTSSEENTSSEQTTNTEQTTSSELTTSAEQTTGAEQAVSSNQATSSEQTPATEQTETSGETDKTNYPNSSYTPLVYKKGNPIMLSKAYCYLLIQAGIDAVDLYSYNDISGEIVKYGFMALKLENKWYYADPGEGVRDDSFTKFGFSESQLSSFGFGKPENPILTTFSEKAVSEVIICDSDRFFDFSAGAYKVVLNTEKNSMLYETEIGVKWNFTRLHG